MLIQKKILIISTNSIGDTYLSLASLESLTFKFPRVQYYLLANEECKILMSMSEGIKFFLIKKRSLLDILKFLIKLRNIEFDFTFSFFPGRLNSIFLLFVKSKIKLGYKNYKLIPEWYNKSQKLFIKGHIIEYDKKWKPNSSYLDRIRYALSPLDINKSISKIKPFNVVVNKTKNEIVIHPFSRSKLRSMGPLLLQGLVKFVSSQFGLKVIVIGAEQDKDYFINPGAVNFISAGNLKDLVSIIVLSRLFIGVDSFPLHIADAYDCNFLGLFSVTNPKSVLSHPAKSVKFDSNSLCDVPLELFIEKISAHFNAF